MRLGSVVFPKGRRRLAAAPLPRGRSRLAAAPLAMLACMAIACLDTRPDKPEPSAGRDATLAAWDAGAGSVKPPSAPPATQRALSSQAGSVAPAARTNALQPTAAGAGGRPEAPMAGAAAAGSGGAAAPPARPTPERAGDVIINELMIDPNALPDADGEWIELHNTTDSELELRDCVLDDGGKSPHALSAALRIAKRAYFTLARSSGPGFKPDATLPLSLTNSADSVAIVCRGIEIDRVSYDRAADFAIKPGVSLALDPSMVDDAQRNDAASAWCEGRDAYSTDLGSPGRENPSCDSESEGEGETDPDGAAEAEEPEEHDAGAGDAESD